MLALYKSPTVSPPPLRTSKPPTSAEQKDLRDLAEEGDEALTKMGRLEWNLVPFLKGFSWFP